MDNRIDAMCRLKSSLQAIGLIYLTMFSLGAHSQTRIEVYLQIASQLESALRSIESSMEAYRRDNQVLDWVCRKDKSSEGLREKCKRELVGTGYLHATDEWEASLFPDYGFLPRFPANGQVNYLSSQEGYYFCVTGDFAQAHVQGVKRTINRFPDGKLVASTSCGSKDSVDFATLDPSDIQLTFWVSSYPVEGQSAGNAGVINPGQYGCQSIGDFASTTELKGRDLADALAEMRKRGNCN